MKEGLQERFHEGEGKEHKAEEKRGVSMTRRGFLKFLAATAGVVAKEGFHGLASAVERPKKTKSPEKKKPEEARSLVEQWERLVRTEVKDMETRPGLFWKEREAKEVREALFQFDIREFIRALAGNGGIRPEEINARLERFSVEPPDPDHPFRMGSMFPKNRSITLHLSGTFFKQGFLDKKRFFSTIRHELTHAISVDYETSDEKRMIPWESLQDPFSIFITPYFYEGATEFVALRASPEKKYNKDAIRSYSEGITLSAYVIARLVGEQVFTRSYLKKDPHLLARAMNKSIGAGAALALTEPLHIRASLRKEGGLDVLHNIFKYDYAYDPLRVKEALRAAWADGIEEMVAYRMDGGVKMTMDLFAAFDDKTGKRFFSIAAAAEGPQVSRFVKNPVSELYENTAFVSLPRHHVSIVIRQADMGEKERKENVRFAAETLRNVLLDEDPKTYREQPLLILGLSREVKNKLSPLNDIDDPFSQKFQDTWVSFQNALSGFITSAMKEVYEQAGVVEDQYVPYPFSPLSSAY